MLNLRLNAARAERYVDFDQMEYMPEIASGMDIYADEMTVSSPFNRFLLLIVPMKKLRNSSYSFL